METTAITFDRFGNPAWQAVHPPEPGPRDVVVDVLAAGVNNADLLQRQGLYPVPAEAPATLGLECSGRLSWVGADVEGWAVGDAVCALLIGGGYAAQVVVPSDQLLPKPENLPFTLAAALPEALCTVYANLAMTAHVTRGSSLLVHGGGSGIGTTAIQWAKALGATVITTVGSDWKRSRVLELGADVAIGYRTSEVDDSGRLDLGTLMAKRASVSATMLRPRSKPEKAAVVSGVRGNAWPLIESGLIVPVVDTVLPIQQVLEAHELLASGRSFGKVVLSVD